MKIQNTTPRNQKPPAPKRIVVIITGFCAGIFSAFYLPPIGFYLAGLMLFWPIQTWQNAHPEDEMLGWWVVILGYPLNLLIYGTITTFLALRISALVHE